MNFPKSAYRPTTNTKNTSRGEVSSTFGNVCACLRDYRGQLGDRIRTSLEVVVVAKLSATLLAESRLVVVVHMPVLHICTKLSANIFVGYGNSILQNLIWSPSVILDILGKS